MERRRAHKTAPAQQKMRGRQRAPPHAPKVAALGGSRAQHTPCERSSGTRCDGGETHRVGRSECRTRRGVGCSCSRSARGFFQQCRQGAAKTAQAKRTGSSPPSKLPMAPSGALEEPSLLLMMVLPSGGVHSPGGSSHSSSAAPPGRCTVIVMDPAAALYR